MDTGLGPVRATCKKKSEFRMFQDFERLVFGSPGAGLERLNENAKIAITIARKGPA